MRFFANDECEAWAASRGVGLSAAKQPDANPDALVQARVLFPETPGQLTWFCRYISACLSPREECLLWVTETTVAPTTANLHLYYRLRESCGDRRLIGEAAGHLFLRFESAELVSFLQIGILNSWDIWLLPELDYGQSDVARVFVSHDGWVQLFHRDRGVVNGWCDDLRNAGYCPNPLEPST